MMGAKRGIAQALVCLLMFPLLAAGIEFAGTQLMPAASAATRCDVEDPNADPGWGRTIDGFNLTGGFFGNNQDWERQDDDWDDPWSNDDNLRRLTTSFHTAFSIQNDTSSGLRMNLSTGFRYTFCITAHGNLSMPNPEAPEIDAYLLTESDYNLYSTWYKTRNDDWGIANEMRDMPVFAQGLVIWQPFRDVHAYEGMSKIEFAVALDHQEVSTNIFEGTSSQRWMYLAVDAFDNVREWDTPAPNQNFTVDVSVMVEERFTLPNWTVSLTCGAILLAVLAAPFVGHTMYMRVGLEGTEIIDVDMPQHLETAPETPEPVSAAPTSPPPTSPPPTAVAPQPAPQPATQPATQPAAAPSAADPWADLDDL